MNILSKVTRKSLIKNRTRTIVTIIGIILSAAMITAVTVSIASLQQYLLNCSIYRDGNWHGNYTDMSTDDMARLQKDKAVDSSAFAQIIGYAEYDNANSDKPYLYILGGDELFFNRMPVHLTDGRLPDNGSEIILPEHLFLNGGERPELGSTVSLSVGDRYLDGQKLNKFTSLSYNDDGSEVAEEFTARTSSTYTVVGYYERPGFEEYSEAGYTALTGWDKSVEAESVEAYFLMDNPKDTFEFMSSFSDSYSWTTNTDVLMFSGASRYDTYYSVVYGMASVLIVLIMFGSISLIYNAFSISVSERTKQFGLLSSIGATKKQIRRMVNIEAVYVSIIGIPVGILSGIFGMWVTFHFIGDKFGSLISTVEVPFRLTATLPAVIVATVVAFVTVLISAWIPSRRATRITAIEAIRQSTDISVKAREVKTSKLTYKLFGLEGAIASKHFKRSRRRYRATVVSLFMSVVLFISASSFCTYLTDAVKGVFESFDYDISYSWNGSLEANDGHELSSAEVADALSETTGITRTSFTKSTSSLVTVEYDQMSAEAQAIVKAMYDPENSDIETENPDAPSYTSRVYVCGIDDETYRQYLKEQGLDEKLYFDAVAPLAVFMPQLSFFNYDTQRMENIDLFGTDATTLAVSLADQKKLDAFYSRDDLTELSDEEYEAECSKCYTDYDISIGATTSELPFGLNSSQNGDLYALYPLSVYNGLFGAFTSNQKVFFKTSDHEAVMEALKNATEESGIPSDPLYDVYATSETEMDLVLIMKVFAYGFITLISLISVANVFNTISTNIQLRRREFAMLKSVGMTSKGFNKMMNYECLLYGTKALLFGIPAAFAVTYFIFRSISAGYDAGFYLPWSSVAIAIGSVFVVVFATMMYAMRRIKCENPIDALKSETI